MVRSPGARTLRKAEYSSRPAGAGVNRNLSAARGTFVRAMERMTLAVMAAAAIATSPAAVFAQGADGGLAPNAPSWCRACTPPPPYVPPVDPPVDPPPGDDDSPSGRRGWAALGAAGLALAAGIPLGAALQPTMPFRPVIAEAAPVTPVEAPGALPSPEAATPGPVANLDQGGNPFAPAGATPGVTQQQAEGVLAPDTASHLPLLLAIGVAAIAGGVALLRDQRRKRRRSMRARH